MKSRLHLPEGWTRLEQGGFGPFVTSELLRRPDGAVVRWESRRHRKRKPHLTGSTWWAPGALGWWIAVLFAIGSCCFALGAMPAYTDAVGAGVDNRTFFVGSIFFTVAALLLFCEVVWADPPARPSRLARLRQLVRPQWRRVDWLAATIQLAGTIFFNVSTGHAVSASAAEVNHLVWRPDVYGSICFLVSSWLSWVEVCHGAWRWRPGQISWWIVTLNLLGSVAFGVSAVCSKALANGALRSVALTNLGTFVGALCFLAGAILLLPERTEGEDPPDLGAPASALA